MYPFPLYHLLRVCDLEMRSSLLVSIHGMLSGNGLTEPVNVDMSRD